MSLRTPDWRIAALVSVVFFCQGCATIFTGTTGTVSVDSQPSGAQVEIYPGNHRLTTPGSIELSTKGSPTYQFTFRKDGYKPTILEVKSTGSNWLWGNLILGGLIGLMIDYGSGGAYTLDPEELQATLEANPSIDTSGNGAQLIVVDESGELLMAVALTNEGS